MGDSVSEFDGFLLILEPPDAPWSSYPHRDLVVDKLLNGMTNTGLTWEKVEQLHEQNGLITVNWICPEDDCCWLCVEYREGKIDLVQTCFPETDNSWSFQLASAVIRVVATFQLAVET